MPYSYDWPMSASELNGLAMESDGGVPEDPNARPLALFDLDGTLTDPTDGIITCHKYALDELDVVYPDTIGPDKLVGLAPSDAHRLLGVPDDKIEATTAKYKERFALAGWLEDTAYDGMEVLLADLAAAGWMLGVAAMKFEPVVVRVVERIGMADRFDVVVGSDSKSKRTNKRAVIQHAVKTVGKPTSGIAIIGDRRQDIEAAKSLQMTAIGAGWGFGAIDELMAANADVVALTPEDVREALVGDG